MTRPLAELTLHSRFHDLGAKLSAPVDLEGMAHPFLVKHDESVAALTGLAPKAFETQLAVEVFSGNQILEGTKPVAQAYAGHQFGNFNPFLGDGRSALLGEIDWQGKSWDLVLKGSGKTPYTFASDGWSTLDECLREYELSAQLHQLGVPTVRCMTIVQGSERAHSGGGGPRAILSRVTPSQVRFGSFEACYFRRDIDALKILSDYVIAHHFLDCVGDSKNQPHNYAKFFGDVVVRTANLIAQWQKVGFVHGMMNTDNQSIVGVTLDLGDSALLEDPDDDFVAARSDRHGRYAFGRQPTVGLWNCNVLARALSPLISANHLRKSLSAYEPTFFERSAG